MYTLALWCMVFLDLGTASEILNVDGLNSGYRDRRSFLVVGAGPIRKLLKGCYQVESSDKYTRLFRKTGDYNSALKDFKAAKPMSVSKFREVNGNEGMFGDVDHRLIMLEKYGDEGTPTIRIMKFFGTGKDVEDKIVYTDKIIYNGVRRMW